MLPRATENAVVGHIWPASRYLPTPALFVLRLSENTEDTGKMTQQ